MKRLKAPSPALVISVIALFVAMAGTGYAAFKVGTKNIKNGAVTTKKLHNGAVTQRKLGSNLSVSNASNANHASNADNASLLGGTPPAALQSKIMTAVVTKSGTAVNVVRGTPGVTAVDNGAGDVNLTFPQRVTGCTWIATQGQPGNQFVNPIYATVRGRDPSTQPNVVTVITYNNANAQTDAPFHLAVIC